MRTKEVINIIKNQSNKLKYAAIIGTTLLIAVTGWLISPRSKLACLQVTSYSTHYTKLSLDYLPTTLVISPFT